MRRVYYRRRRVLVFKAAGLTATRKACPYRELEEPADEVMIIVPVAEPAITFLL